MVKGNILGICDGVPLSATLFCLYVIITLILERKLYNFSFSCEQSMASLSLLAGRAVHLLIFFKMCVQVIIRYMPSLTSGGSSVEMEIWMKYQLYSSVIRAVNMWFEEGRNIACLAE